MSVPFVRPSPLARQPADWALTLQEELSTTSVGTTSRKRAQSRRIPELDWVHHRHIAVDTATWGGAAVEGHLHDEHCPELPIALYHQHRLWISFQRGG
jgi:hypothetical protein